MFNYTRPFTPAPPEGFSEVVPLEDARGTLYKEQNGNPMALTIESKADEMPILAFENVSPKLLSLLDKTMVFVKEVETTWHPESQ